MTRTTQLIHDHSEFRSAAALGRAIGEPNLTRKLSRIRTDRLIPSAELLDKIAAHLDPAGRRLLVQTVAEDAQLPGYVNRDDGAATPFQRLVRSLNDEDLRLATELLKRLAGVDPLGAPDADDTGESRS